MHLSDHLGYYQIIKDGREREKQEILDFIIKTFEEKKCDGVVFMGDQFDKKNNPASVIKEFTKFVERFGDKPIYIIAGNHELSPTGESALDYLKEISGKNWHIITDKMELIDNMLFCPYIYKAQLEASDDKDATEKLMQIFLTEAGKGKTFPLFTHFSISDTITSSGQNTNFFNEIVLDNDSLHKVFNPVFSGHIHQPSERGDDFKKTIITGSIFNQEVGERGKNIFIYDYETNKTETIKLPGRGIYKLENPKKEDIDHISKNNIVKVYITDRKIDINKIKDSLKKFDGQVIVEQYPNERKKVVYENQLMDLNIENLLTLYAKQKGINIKTLMEAWSKIK